MMLQQTMKASVSGTQKTRKEQRSALTRDAIHEGSKRLAPAHGQLARRRKSKVAHGAHPRVQLRVESREAAAADVKPASALG